MRPENKPPPLREIKATSASETPPDWGGSETDENQAEPHHNHESSDEGEPGQPCNQWPWGPEGRPSDSGTSRGVLAYRPAEPAGNRHNTYDDETYQRSDLPHRGETPLQDRGNPSTFGQTNGGALSTRYRPIWPNSEKIHVKAGGAVSERAPQNSVSTFSFACEAKPSLIMTGRGARTTTKGEP